MKKLEFRRKYEQNGGSYQQGGVDKEGKKEGWGESRYARGERGEGLQDYGITGLEDGGLCGERV